MTPENQDQNNVNNKLLKSTATKSNTSRQHNPVRVGNHPPSPPTPERNPFDSYKHRIEAEKSGSPPSNKKLKTATNSSASNFVLGTGIPNPFYNQSMPNNVAASNTSKTSSSSSVSPSSVSFSSQSQSSNSDLLENVVKAITLLKGNSPKICSHCSDPVKNCCKQSILDEVLNHLPHEQGRNQDFKLLRAKL